MSRAVTVESRCDFGRWKELQPEDGEEWILLTKAGSRKIFAGWRRDEDTGRLLGGKTVKARDDARTVFVQIITGVIILLCTHIVLSTAVIEQDIIYTLFATCVFTPVQMTMMAHLTIT